jgi:hypothetical protein
MSEEENNESNMDDWRDNSSEPDADTQDDA